MRKRGQRLKPVSDPLNKAADIRDADLLETVSAALKHNEVLLAFQPVVQATGKQGVAFYEGLIRVLDATGRVIPAGQFMTSAENTQLGRDLDCTALQMGLSTLARHRQIRLSINMSARSIGYKRWTRTLTQSLKKNPHLGERLILEVNEQSAMQMPDLIHAFVEEMQQYGIAFALDDFGAGLTALRHLRDFDFDILKIDGQFVRHIDAHPDNQALVSGIVAMARQFDIFTVAEKVESKAEAAALSQLGVDCLQGFCFGAPALDPPWQQDRDRQQSA